MTQKREEKVSGDQKERRVTTSTQDNPSTEESLARTSDRTITTRRPLMRPVTKTYVLMLLSLSTDRLTSAPHVPELLDQQGVFLGDW